MNYKTYHKLYDFLEKEKLRVHEEYVIAHNAISFARVAQTYRDKIYQQKRRKEIELDLMQEELRESAYAYSQLHENEELQEFWKPRDSVAKDSAMKISVP